MNEIKLVINQTPIAQPRPRVTKFGTFDPNKEKKSWIKLQMKQQVSVCIDKPLTCIMLFCMPIPKSISKKKAKLMLDGAIHHTKKPDIDNIVKTYFDCMNEIAFKDDSQIYSLKVFKCYSDKPRTEIILRWEDE